MTEEAQVITIEEHAANYIKAMKEGNTDELVIIAESQKTDEDKVACLTAVIEAIGKEDDEFKETHKELIEALDSTLKVLAEMDKQLKEAAEEAKDPA